MYPCLNLSRLTHVFCIIVPIIADGTSLQIKACLFEIDAMPDTVQRDTENTPVNLAVLFGTKHGKTKIETMKKSLLYLVLTKFYANL